VFAKQSTEQKTLSCHFTEFFLVAADIICGPRWRDLYWAWTSDSIFI